MREVLFVEEVELHPIESDEIVGQSFQKDTISWKFIDSFSESIKKFKGLTDVCYRTIYLSSIWIACIACRNNRCHKSQLYTSNLNAIGILNTKPLKLQTDSPHSNIENNLEDMVDIVRIERCNSCNLCSIDIDGKFFTDRYYCRRHVCDFQQVLSLCCYEDVLTNFGCCSIGVSVGCLCETDWTGVAFVQAS